ncbi:MAG: hypothetical protein FJZ58_03170 [Chlamydiae bacterium]|nr:hypothetical protein [Chlamydiota bacterium]
MTYANLTLFPSSHLSDLLNELEAHIDELSPVQEQLYFAEFFPLHEYEQTALYSFIVRLRTPLTQEESSLYKWMHFPQGEDDEPIPLPVYHLQWILQACTSQAVEQSQDLSDQERLLIRFVIFMHHYLDVKEEGLSAFYQELFPVQFTPDADKPVLGYFSFFTKKEACRRSFWLSSPQSPFLQNIFPSTFQIQTEESRHLLMHQTVYLKNLLSKELGIPHQLVINPINEAYVHSSLLQKTKSDLLRSFFSLYTVAYVINAFQKQLQKDLNEPLFMAIDQFARDRQSKKPKNFWMQHENELTVTEQGARWLLQEAGILTNSSG